MRLNGEVEADEAQKNATKKGVWRKRGGIELLSCQHGRFESFFQTEQNIQKLSGVFQLGFDLIIVIQFRLRRCRCLLPCCVTCRHKGMIREQPNSRPPRHPTPCFKTLIALPIARHHV